MAGATFSDKMNSDRILRRFAPFLALGVTTALALIAYRGIPRIGFDSHYFLEYAKEFRHRFPRSLGSDWPYGYPLLGAAVSRLGLSVFASMLTVLAVGLFAIWKLLWPVIDSALGRGGLTAGVIASLAAASILPIEFGGLRSEIPFAALYLATVIALAEWPAPHSIVAASLAAMLSFLIRYAGVLTLGVLIAWTIWRWSDLARERRRGLAAAAVAGAVCVCALLMLSNYLVLRGFQWVPELRFL